MKALCTASSSLAIPLLLITPARADVLTVDPGGGGQYTDLQTAIDDAEDGDTLVLAPGSYDGPVPGIVVSDKDLRILGETPRPQLVRDLLVSDLAAGKVVVLTNLEVDARHLDISSCAGSVRVQECVVDQGTSVVACDDVVFSRTSMMGADGVAGGPPEHGLVVDGSSVALYSCSAVGGDGDPDPPPLSATAAAGGSGCLVTGNGFFYTSDGSFEGGAGGNGHEADLVDPPVSGGDGGNGITLAHGDVVVLDSDRFGGAGGMASTCAPAFPTCGDGHPPVSDGAAGVGTFIVPGPDPTSLDEIAGLARTMEVEPWVEETDVVTVTFHGQPGDLVFFPRQSDPTFLYDPVWRGVWAQPQSGSPQLGVIPGSGTLVLDVELPPTICRGEADFLQAAFIDTAPMPIERFIATPVALVRVQEPPGFATNRLQLSGLEMTDVFGYSVAVTGDRLIVGSVADDAACPGNMNCNSGVAYVFELTGAGWVMTGELVPSDGQAQAEFGQDVGISGDWAIVTAHKADTGKVYSFHEEGGVWTEKQIFTGSDSQTNFHFGHSTTLEGTTAVIGSMLDDHQGPETGSAFIFERPGSTWMEVAKLTASDAASGDRFGRSSDLQGDVAVVGAHLHDEFGDDSGAAYVFERDDPGTPLDRLDDTWPETIELLPSDGTAGDLFGRSVGVYGDTIVVGAAEDEVDGVRTGSVYVFERSGGTWVETQKLVPCDGDEGDEFGISLAISGNRLLVGAQNDDDSAVDGGAAYVYERIDGTWVAIGKIVAPDAGTGDRLGGEQNVQIDGTRVIVGAPFNDVAITNGGAAYVVELGEDTSYCDTKVSSLGCVPAIGSSGAATATGGDDFFITARGILGDTTGVLLWGLSARPPGGTGPLRQIGSSPFGGRLCVFAPLPGAVQASGGTPGSCDGTFGFHFSQELMTTHGLMSGTTVHAQYFYRDPNHPDGSGLGHTEAARFTIGP